MAKRKLSAARYKTARDEKDGGGSGFKSYIDWSKLGEKRVKFYSADEGTNKINIIPFEIKSKLNPLVHKKKLEVGDLDYALDIWVHRNIGPEKEALICPKKNYGKACPICEQASEYYEAGKKDEYQAVKATERTLLNVQPIRKGEAQELHVFDVSHYLFHKELIEEANECGSGDDIEPFADIDKGKMVKFRMAVVQLGKNKVPEYKSFSFIEREEELDEDLIDQAVSFDELFVLKTAKELEDIMYGKEAEKDEDEADEEPTPKKKKAADMPPTDDEEEEPEPKKEKPKAEKKKAKGDCPHDHEFGEADEYPECKKCESWEACDDAA